MDIVSPISGNQDGLDFTFKRQNRKKIIDDDPAMSSNQNLPIMKQLAALAPNEQEQGLNVRSRSDSRAHNLHIEDIFTQPNEQTRMDKLKALRIETKSPSLKPKIQPNLTISSFGGGRERADPAMSRSE